MSGGLDQTFQKGKGSPILYSYYTVDSSLAHKSSLINYVTLLRTAYVLLQIVDLRCTTIPTVN